MGGEGQGEKGQKVVFIAVIRQDLKKAILKLQVRGWRCERSGVGGARGGGSCRCVLWVGNGRGGKGQRVVLIDAIRQDPDKAILQLQVRVWTRGGRVT